MKKFGIISALIGFILILGSAGSFDASVMQGAEINYTAGIVGAIAVIIGMVAYSRKGEKND